MLQTTILVLATLSGSATQNVTMISNSNNAVTHAKQEISEMQQTFLQTHKFDPKLLLKDLNAIYNSQSHQKLNLKDGRNWCKVHWYDTMELWINNEKGTKLDNLIKDGADIGAFIDLLISIFSHSVAIALGAVGTFLFAEWDITWRETNTNHRGIHMEILMTTPPVIVYAHAQ